MNNFDDADIKIFGSSKTEKEVDVLVNMMEVMKVQRENGNVDRAKELGTKIANQICVPERINKSFLEKVSEFKDNDAIVEQMKLLATFAAEAEIHVALEKYSVSMTAVNALYDELLKLDDDLYDNITDAFTYYYLVLRKGGDIDFYMGKKFAKLCGDGHNEKLEKLGTETFIAAKKLTSAEIEKLGFAES